MECNMEKNRIFSLLTGIILWLALFLVYQGCAKLRYDLTLQDSGRCAAAACHSFTVLQKITPDTGKHTAHLAMGFDCGTCHDQYLKNSLHKNGTNDRYSGETIVFFNSVNPDASWNDSITSCENLNCHVNADWYGSTSFVCTSCHSGGNSIDPLILNGSGTEGKHQKHVTERGIPCEKCHSDYTGISTHANGTLDTDNSSILITFFDSTNPAGSWTGDSGADTGSCALLACHGGSTLDWYGSNIWVLPACDICHRTAVGSRRQVFDSNGDGSGTGGDFNLASHHVLDYTDPSIQLVTGTDCLVCHDQTGHMGGTVRLKDKDNAGTQIVYDPGDPSSLEPFCLSCHDSNGATAEGSPLSPFSSSSILGTPPYVRGLLIEDNWLKTYGHGTNGDHAAGDRLTCMGSGSPGTGCHGNGGSINAHGSVNEIIGAKEYKYSLAFGYYDETWFSLCFDCHSNYPGITKEDTLGVKAGGILDNEAWLDNCSNCHFSFTPTTNAFPPYNTTGVTTHFADHDEAGDPWGLNDGVNPYLSMPTDNNLHWLHLGMYVSDYRGLSENGLVTCSNCHSVHGSNTLCGAVHDEMGYINVSDGNGNTYGQMKTEAYDENDGTPDYLSSYPTYCDMSCHEKTGPTRAWFSPITE